MVEELTETEPEIWKVKASIENGYRLMQVRLPAIFTVTRSLNAPRVLSFSGIIKARKKQILCWSSSDLGVAEDTVGLSGSPTAVSAMTIRTSRRQVEFIHGTSEEKADTLVQELAGAGLI
jgi:electron transfer flavoprotein beta subunit